MIIIFGFGSIIDYFRLLCYLYKGVCGLLPFSDNVEIYVYYPLGTFLKFRQVLVDYLRLTGLS